jgi:hypothetical protein
VNGFGEAVASTSARNFYIISVFFALKSISVINYQSYQY